VLLILRLASAAGSRSCRSFSRGWCGTLELCVVLGLPLNFANVLALPLLLGVGIAFKIYYIMAWRPGKTALLQSSLTRAVVLSAMTTATGFGSLWFSSHPGTSSMGS
jgi:predicted exporter